MRKLFSLLLFLSPLLLYAQQPAVAIAEVSSAKGVDSNYVHNYKDKMILALWQSERRFEVSVTQTMNADSGLSKINYIANSNQVTGVSLDFDIIGFAIGFRSVPNRDERKVNTDYLDLGLNFTTKGIRFENSFKRYTGFYDANTKNYTIPFNDSTPYYKNPSMNIRTVKSKLIYTINKNKFALGAAYANTKRQVKGAGSWLVIANFYGLSMNADSSIIPWQIHPNYGIVWDGFNKMNIYAYSFGAGGTRTFVFWRNFYFNVLASLGLERQFRHFYTYPENVHFSYWKTWFAADWRVVLGYNNKNFFMRISSISDINRYDGQDMEIGLKFIGGSFDIGYRFGIKPPRVYKKFQETKLYGYF